MSTSFSSLRAIAQQLCCLSRSSTYLLGVVLLALYLLVSFTALPQRWGGHTYHDGRPGGTFGLDHDWAPLRDPPQAVFDLNSAEWYGTPPEATVRLPWQPISTVGKASHIELDLFPLYEKLWLGLMVLGALCFPWKRPREASRASWLALTLPGGVALGAWVLFVIGMFSMGYAFSEPLVVYPCLVGGALAGLAFGWLGRRRLGQRGKAPARAEALCAA